MITQTINLNMVPGSVYPVIHVSQYDNDAGALKFNLFNNSAFTIPAGSAVVINGTKPDGYGFSYSATYSGNVVTADVTQQMTAVAGEVKCELRITKNSDVIGTQNFTLMVEPAALDDNTIISDSDIPAIAAAADYAAEAAASAAEAAATLSSKVSKSGDTMTGALTVPGFSATGNSVSISYPSAWRSALGTAPTLTGNIAPNDVSVETGTATDLFSISLSPGLNIIQISIQWANNSDGYRKIMLGGSAGGDYGYLFQSIVRAADGAATIQNHTFMRLVSSATTAYVTGTQNSGSTLTAKNRYQVAVIPV